LVRYTCTPKTVNTRAYVSASHFYSCVLFDGYILFLFLGKPVNETCSLGDLGVVPNGTIQLQLQSADPVNHPLQLIRPRQEYLMPDVITVRIHIGLFL